MEIIKIEPFFSQRLWGSRDLETKYNFKLPRDNNKYGEAWLISALDNGPSFIRKTNNELISLKDYFSQNKHKFKNQINHTQFPLLSKIITANDTLSIQVHPNDEYSLKKHNMLGKPECWYVLDCPKNSYIIYGHNAKNKDELIKYIDEKKWTTLFRKIKINKGDFIYIPPGKIHALTSGVAVYELQRSSDITYRLYDFDRIDKNGKLRDLHIKDSINTTLIPDKNNLIEKNKKGLLIDNDYFTLFMLDKNFNKTIKNINWGQVTVIDGELIIGDEKMKKGESALLFSDDNNWNFKINKSKILFSYIK